MEDNEGNGNNVCIGKILLALFWSLIWSCRGQRSWGNKAMVASWRKMRPASSHKKSIIWCTRYHREQKIFYAEVSHGQKENNLLVKVDKRYQHAKMVMNYDNDDDSGYQGNKQEHRASPTPCFSRAHCCCCWPNSLSLAKNHDDDDDDEVEEEKEEDFFLVQLLYGDDDQESTEVVFHIKRMEKRRMPQQLFRSH